MNLRFVKIGKKGEDDEYILFKAVGDCNLHNYLVHDDTFDADGDISNKLRHMYRFPKLSVKEDEYVALYVKKQGQYVKGNFGEAVCHLLYWGTNTNIFNNNGDNLYLLLISQTSRATIR